MPVRSERRPVSTGAHARMAPAAIMHLAAPQRAARQRALVRRHELGDVSAKPHEQRQPVDMRRRPQPIRHGDGTQPLARARRADAQVPRSRLAAVLRHIGQRRQELSLSLLPHTLCKYPAGKWWRGRKEGGQVQTRARSGRAISGEGAAEIREERQLTRRVEGNRDMECTRACTYILEAAGDAREEGGLAHSVSAAE